MQIDGEAFNVDDGPVGAEAFDVSIDFQNQAFLLARGDTSEGNANAYTSIETQLQQKTLGTAQRDALLRALGSD